MSRPLAVDRHGQILHALEAQGSVSVADLAERFNVSMETIRRDLKLLAEEGRLVTVHGGAQMNPPSPGAPLKMQRARQRLAGRQQISLKMEWPFSSILAQRHWPLHKR